MRFPTVLRFCLGSLFCAQVFGCADQVAFRGRVIGQPSQPPRAGVTRDTTELAATAESLRGLTEPYLKCHLWDGSVIVLQNYRVVSPERSAMSANAPTSMSIGKSDAGANAPYVEGDGIKYDSTRVVHERGHFTVPLATVALFESNRPESVASARVPVMATVTIASAALTALCIAAPKACFGSCPTIYAPSPNGQVLQAEGFSSSIAKRLESTDVDSLSLVPEVWPAPQLELTNEAPETHSIDSLTLLATAKPASVSVYRSGSEYWATSSTVAPSRCTSPNGSCLEAILAEDGLEYKSDTDGKDLAHREQLVLEFESVPKGALGLVVTARNSLLNSYLFYQALAYMGHDAGQYFALLERGRLPALSGSQKLGEILGGIDFAVQDARGNFQEFGQYFEVGPLAKETELFRVPASEQRPLRIQLTMALGNMRLDRAALVSLQERVVPERLAPIRVEHQGKEDPEALSRLLGAGQYLVTYPGDAYTVHYPKPRCSSCAWFIESRGYYYEWMRDVWMREQDPARLMKLLYSPREALRELAPAYRKLEPEIDRIFWQSHIEPRRDAAGALP